MFKSGVDTAIILAGGLGTRLRPLTDNCPKPLLPLLGKPILQHTIENLRDHGIKKVILSVGYKADQIERYFSNGSQLGVDITYCVENEPLGTGGAVKKAAENINSEFILVWGDNVMDTNVSKMMYDHRHSNNLMTMALTKREDVEHFGVAKLHDNTIISFVEKPQREEAPSNLINAGFFIINPQILTRLPTGKSSIERDLFEKIVAEGKVGAHIHQGQWFPTDTLEKYNLTCQTYKPKINFAEKKYIIADVDDTICHSCQLIEDDMAHHINSLIRQGFQFAFISGTKNDDLKKMISTKLTQEHHLLGTTGTHYEYINNENCTSKYNHSLTEEEKAEILLALDTLIEHYNIVPVTSKEDQVQDRISQITLSAIGRNAPHDQKKKYDPDGSIRQVWAQFLKQHIDDSKYSIKIGGTTSVDITKKGLDKEWGIREFAGFHNIKLNQILFLGDKIYPGGNDYAASKIVDCISVANTSDTLGILHNILHQIK